MLGLGFSEILMVGAVLLVVVGPDRLPQVFREMGRIYGKIRRASDDLRRAFVLEADRQDAAERVRDLEVRRAEIKRARDQALRDAGGHSVDHTAPEPPPPSTAPPPPDAPPEASP